MDKDKDNIGLSIIDIKDKLGLTALHYSIIFNNYEAFKYLLNKNINYLSTANSPVIFDDYNMSEIRIYINNKINNNNITKIVDPALINTTLHFIYKYN